MEQIPIRALNQDTAGVLARVERGEAVEITNRGRPIARIVPVDDSAVADLVAAGIVLPPTISGPLPMPTAPLDADQPEGGALLSALRDEERW